MTEAEKKRAEKRHKRRDLGPKSTIKPGHILKSSDDPAKLERVLEGRDNPWPTLAASPWLDVSSYTPRQRLALEHPQDVTDWGYATGPHTGDPRFRRIEIHNDPHRADVAHVRTLGDEYQEQRRYQLASILTVDVDRHVTGSGMVIPMLWHASFAWLYNPEDKMIEPRFYLNVNGKAQYDWMGEILRRAIVQLVPGARTRHLYRDLGAHSVHLRCPLEPHEVAIVEALGG